jgi:hypothetical protein
VTVPLSWRALWAPMAVGLALRLRHLLPARPLWLDEAITALAARAPDPLAAVTLTDLHPPWLVLLLRGVGDSELVLRAPSFVASMLTIPALAWAAAAPAEETPSGRDLAPHEGRTTDILPTLAAWCAALSPAWVRYAGEARPYALAVLASTLLAGAALRRSPLGLTLAGALALGATWGTWPLVAAALALYTRATRDPRPLLALTLLAAWLLVVVALPQLRGPGVGLADGWLGPWLPHTTAGLVAAAVDSVGYAFVGSDGPDALLVGALALLLLRPGPALPLAASALGLALGAAALGLHPAGATRHALPLTPVIVLALLLSCPPPPRWLYAALSLLMLRGLFVDRGLPVQDVPALLQQLDGAPLVVDGSVAPVARWYAPERVARALPWRRPERIHAELHDLPPGPFWLVAAEGRLHPGVSAALAGQGRVVGEERAAAGVVAWRVSSALTGSPARPARRSGAR